MREAMAVLAGPGDRRCKRLAVVLCAAAHLVLTLVMLSVFLGPSSEGSAPFSDYLRRWDSFRVQGRNLTTLQWANRKAALEWRPLTLIDRVQHIQAEVAQNSQAHHHQVEKSEQEELEEQVELEVGQGGPPAIEDDELGVIERAIPPEKCYPEVRTDFGGDAVRWGLSYHVSSAGECCNACSRQAAFAQAGQRRCNVWVFCPESKGCQSPDGYEHKFGECWLKQADQPRAFVHDYSILGLVPSIPVLWISGVIPFNGG